MKAIFVMVSLLTGQAQPGVSATSNPDKEVTPSSPLWRTLAAGSYSVGFRTMFKFDTSRTWRVTRDYTGKFTADPHGRPVQLNVWYPARSNAPGRQMTVAGYIDQTAPDEFSTLNELMLNRNRENAANSASVEQLAALRATSVMAVSEAAPEAGSFPIVLYFGGLNADINSNFILAEFLASHGYVFVSISLLGITDKQSSQARTPSDLDAVVRDMEFALQILGEGTNADRTKLGVMGHSLGAIEATMLGLRNGNVLAVIGLEGTYGFKGSAGVLTDSYGYSPVKMRAAFLDLRRAQGEQHADLDLEPVLSFRFCDRSLVTLTKMHHSDFTSFASVAAAFKIPIKPEYVGTGWNRETGRNGYENACEIVLQFLDEKVKGEAPGSDKFRQAIQRADGSLTHHDANYAPLSPREVVTLANKTGLEAVKTLLNKVSGKQPVSTYVDASSFNTYGYELLGQRQAKDALFVFEIVAWAHPTSANAYDSLADAHVALGDKEAARSAIRRAIALAPTDSTITADSKASFIKDESSRLERLQ